MKKDTRLHPKFKRLKRRLKLAEYQAVGLLETLWQVTACSAQAGDIGRLTDEDIAMELEWEGDKDQLVDALVDCGWVDRCDDHRLLIHDWPDHAPNWIKAMLARQNKTFIGSDPPKTGNSVANLVNNSVTTQDALTQPNLTQPNLTKPSPAQPQQDAAKQAAGGGGDACWQSFVEAMERWTGDSTLLLHHMNDMNAIGQAITGPIFIDGQSVDLWHLCQVAVEQFIDKQVTTRSSRGAIKYVTETVKRCQRDHCWPGEYKPSGGSGFITAEDLEKLV